MLVVEGGIRENSIEKNFYHFYFQCPRYSTEQMFKLCGTGWQQTVFTSLWVIDKVSCDIDLLLGNKKSGPIFNECQLSILGKAIHKI